LRKNCIEAMRQDLKEIGLSHDEAQESWVDGEDAG